ncbi:MAG: hypothetical protein ABL900_11075 [Burkholderiaceae bacterium]
MASRPDHALTRRDLLPSVRTLAWVLLLFALAIVLARSYATPIGAALSDHQALGVVLFTALGGAPFALLFAFFPALPWALRHGRWKWSWRR